jgi:hypothetical protein
MVVSIRPGRRRHSFGKDNPHSSYKNLFLFRDLGLCVKNFNSAVDNLPGIMKMWKRQDQDTNLVAPVKNDIKAAPSLS